MIKRRRDGFTPVGSYLLPFGGVISIYLCVDVGLCPSPALSSACHLPIICVSSACYLFLSSACHQAVDAVFVGNVIQSSTDACYLARHVGLRAGAPQKAPALTINR